MAETPDSASLLDKLGGPTDALKQFDAFPKLPSTYRRRSDSRGFLTLLIGLLCFTLVLNDIGEFIWGWPEYHFSMDKEVHSYIPINLDIIVNMPCRFLSVDLRDTLGDRLHLTGGFRRDGVAFDIAQAQKLQEQSEIQSQSTLIPQTRQTRGLLATLFRGGRTDFKSSYKHSSADDACRIYGTMVAKKVTANLHITSLGHGYASAVHVEHQLMNLSHIISEFSFGPYFPSIVQPLDNTYSLTHHHFTAHQYFLSVVPTKYKPARGRTMRTHQYSVTNYIRELEHGVGTPGIFFKFDLDPLSIEVEEKTTTLIQFLIRVVGVVGGVWCCMGWAVKVSFRAYEAVTGTSEGDEPIVAIESTGVKRRWGGGDLKKRVVQQGNGWVVTPGESDWGNQSPVTSSSPYSGAYAASPGYASNFPLPPSVPPTAGPGGYFPSPKSAAQGSFPHHQRQFSAASNLLPPSPLPTKTQLSSPSPPNSNTPVNGSGTTGRAPGPNGRSLSQEDKALKDR